MLLPFRLRVAMAIELECGKSVETQGRRGGRWAVGELVAN